MLVLPTLLVALDVNVLFLALPELSADLGTSGVQQLWITDVYGFMVAGLVITMGTLGDRIGRRRLLLAGGAAFAAASAAAAYATSPAMLIGARTLLGVAGATLMPSTLALITNMFRDARQRGSAIAVWATCQFAGAALGPVVGGVLLERFWWGSVFLMAVPVMAVLLVAGPCCCPSSARPARGGSIRSASRCRCWPSCPRCTASRTWPPRATGRGPSRSPRSPRGPCSPCCSRGASSGWTNRCWTCACSSAARSRWCWPRSRSPGSPWPERG
ncbi:MFS transporter [Actinomadura yumaensis]|uniref:MFS transporter n=1 Tax=Actinomadura yumaensis TaxID=111807 RepID=UPI0036182383